MKKILSILTFLVLALGVSAVTDVDYYVSSPSGNVEITTSYSVGGFDGASDPTRQMTSTDYQHIENTGSLVMSQSARSYGTGLEWPNTNNGMQDPWPGNGEDYGEWAGKQQTWIDTNGESTYTRTYSAWTVHPDWSTSYDFGGSLTSPTTSTFIMGEGSIQGNEFVTQTTYDNSGQEPYEDYKIDSYSFTNPFVGYSAFGWVNGFLYN